MARPRKLSDNSTGNTSKEFKEQRKQAEKKLEEFEPISHDPPEWLNDVAKAEYKRVVPLMEQLPISALDYTSLAMYCDCFSKYKESSKLVDQQGRTIIELDSQGNEKKRMNPEYTAMADAARMVRAFAGNLGLTIDSRLKLVVPTKEVEDDPFSEMMR